MTFPCLALGSAAAQGHRSITWERLQASGPELQAIGELATRHARDIDSSPWSVGCETLDRDQARFSVYREYVGALGVKHARLQSGWAKCERQKDVYDFAWLDECVYGLSEQGVTPWMCLCYGNPIYGSEVQLGAGLAAVVNDEEAFAAWLRYVEAVVARYADTITEWEVWNEPNGHPCEDYARLLIATSEAIRKVQPEAEVLGLSLAGVDPDFAKGVLDIVRERGKLDCLDRVTYHPYARNPDASYPAVEKLRDLVVSYDPRISLYQGENGCPSILEWTHALANHTWTEYSQAKWFLRRLAGDRVRGIASSAFTIIDLRYPDMLQSFGLIRSNLKHEFIYKRPAYYAVQHLVGFFDQEVEPRGLLSCESASPRPLTVAGFEKAGTPVLLVWYGDQVPSDELAWEPVDLTAAGVEFEDPVYVEMITGKVYELGPEMCRATEDGVAFSGLPVWDSPVMVAERAMVPLARAGDA